MSKFANFISFSSFGFQETIIYWKEQGKTSELEKLMAVITHLAVEKRQLRERHGERGLD